MHQREILLKGFDPADHLRLRERQPVPVQIKQIMIRASCRPGFATLGSDRRNARLNAVSFTEVVHKTHPAVRILTGVYRHQRVVTDTVEGLSLSGQQMIGGLQARIRAGNFIAMYPIGKPDNSRQFSNQRINFTAGQFSRIGQCLHAGLDLVKPTHSLFTADQKIDQRPAFPAAGIFNQSRSRRLCF